MAGQIQNFTGVNDPYEAPESPEITVHTDQENVDQSVAHIIEYLESRELIPQTQSVQN